MSASSLITKTLLIGAVATAVSACDSIDMSGGDAKEKCYGVAKAGANDCGNGVHNCAGHAAVDNDSTEWLYVPEGLCRKLAGGSFYPRG
jgi:uncharacterized membrane protein